MIHISDEGNVQVGEQTLDVDRCTSSVSKPCLLTGPMQSDSRWAVSQQASAQGLTNLQGGDSGNLEHL